MPHRLFRTLVLSIASTIAAQAGLHAQNLCPDMRTWTFHSTNTSIVVTQAVDKIAWSSCACDPFVPVACKVRWLVPETGHYMMITETVNTSPDSDPWSFGIVSPRSGDGLYRAWRDRTRTMQYGDFPQAVGHLTKGDTVEIFVNGISTRSGTRELRVDLAHVDLPVFQGLKWASFQKTQVDLTITPRLPTGSQWLFFASPNRLPAALRIPGLGGPGLWLTAPVFVAAEQRLDVQMVFPVDLRDWPRLHWQLVEITMTSQGLALTSGSPNDLFSR
ncbi:MAG: hypothetical protein KDC95_20850 [Planctomycetes bacterium]|nr:hypothetical protein [Planctomycetota bacterium]